MKFYGRTEEVELLRKTRELSQKFAQFIVVTGRRRVGKTEVIKQALNDGQGDFVYLLITKQTEKSLCADLQRDLETAAGGRVRIHGRCDRVIDIVKELFEEAQRGPLTVVIDELQEMDKVNPSFFGALQGLWDEYHNRVQLNLVVSGSVNRLMNKIFFSYGEPLYGRNTERLEIKPFPVSVLKEILADFSPGYSAEDLLALWTFTGGVARYVELLMTAGAFTREKMIEAIFGRLTAFQDEGKIVLMEEFGTDYATYFSILAAIAFGHTKFAEIGNDLGIEVGTFLANLNEKYELISRVRPFLDKERSKNSVYRIEDCFFRFWFRFVFKYQSLIVLGRQGQLQALVNRDYGVFSGYALERYFQWKMICESDCTNMGGWWDRKGENEIDLICENELNETIDFYEIKVDESRYDQTALEAKVSAFLQKHPEKSAWKRKLSLLTLKDM